MKVPADRCSLLGFACGRKGLASPLAVMNVPIRIVFDLVILAVTAMEIQQAGGSPAAPFMMDGNENLSKKVIVEEDSPIPGEDGSHEWSVVQKVNPGETALHYIKNWRPCRCQ